MHQQLIIIGASGHGKVVSDIARAMGCYKSISFLDDDMDLDGCNGFPVVGTCRVMASYIDTSDFIVAIGNSNIRKKLTEQIVSIGGSMATLIHPSAVLGTNVIIGPGTVVMAGTVINTDCRIGKGCIINTSSSVDHECSIADYVHVSVGAHLAGNVTVGSCTWVGIGAVISNNLAVTKDCMIGAGAVVVKDINESGTYIGVPARRLKMKQIRNYAGGGIPLEKKQSMWISAFAQHRRRAA